MSAPLSDPLPEPFPTDEETLRDLLRTVFPGSPAARAYGANGHAEPSEDPGAVAARVERLSETGLPAPDATEFADALADVELLADLSAAECAVASGAATAPSAAVGAAARAAFDADLLAASSLAAPAPQSERVPEESRSLRVLHARRPKPTAAVLRAVAAVVVVGLGLAWFVRPRAAEAEPRLVLAGIDRYALGEAGSRIELVGRRDARLGEQFKAGHSELLALKLAAPEGDGGGRLVLRAGANAGVYAAQSFRNEPGAEGGALLRLENGEALLACEDAPLPAPLALLIAPRAHTESQAEPLGLLVLTHGAAHVALAGSERPAVALADGARARFVPLGGTAVELRGPAHVLLSRDAPVVLGEPARALFRDLELFGGPLKTRAVEPFVGARLWRVVSGKARRGGEGLALPAPTATPAGQPDVVLGWTPDPTSAKARVLRLLLRGPEGLLVTLPGVASDGTAPTATLAAPAAGSEPGLVTLDLPLPEGWTAGLVDGELRLALSWPHGLPAASRSEVRFDGALLGASAEGSR